MATLNIDKSLIDQSALVQTDEVNLHHSLLQCTFLRRRVAKSPNLSSKSLECLHFVIKLDPSQIELCILQKNKICLKFSYSEKAMFCHEFSNGSLNLSFLIHWKRATTFLTLQIRNVKKWEIFSNFVAFSQRLNFNFSCMRKERFKEPLLNSWQNRLSFLTLWSWINKIWSARSSN